MPLLDSAQNPDHVGIYGNLDEISRDAGLSPLAPLDPRIFVDVRAHQRWWRAPGRVKLVGLEHDRRGNR